jgi:hypothetical protein
MAVIVLISIIAFFLTLLESKNLLRGGMALGFIVITLISIIRYDYGNDYMGYYNDFSDDCMYDIKDIIAFSDYLKDFGWIILSKLFEPLGFFCFVACISLVTNVIYYRFIKENVNRQNYWLAMFIYLFTFDLFALQLSMIRQGFVIALFVLSYHYLKNKQLLIPIILTVLSISFHKSAIILVPFLLLSKYPFQFSGKSVSILLLVLFVLFFLSKNIINQLLNNALSLDVLSTYDSDYGLEEGNGVGIRAVLEFIPFFISLYYLGSKKTLNGPRYLVLLSTISTLIFPFTTIIHLISRMSFYFSIFTIAAVPLTYNNINNKLIRYFFLFLFLGITLYVYFDRFTNSVYTIPYANFRTIFNVS